MTEPKYQEFVWIDTRSDKTTGIIYLRFGKSLDDPMPFVLTVTPSYVAQKMQTTRRLRMIEVHNYCNENREALRKIAFNCKQHGKNAEVLE